MHLETAFEDYRRYLNSFRFWIGAVIFSSVMMIALFVLMEPEFSVTSKKTCQDVFTENYGLKDDVLYVSPRNKRYIYVFYNIPTDRLSELTLGIENHIKENKPLKICTNFGDKISQYHSISFNDEFYPNVSSEEKGWGVVRGVVIIMIIASTIIGLLFTKIYREKIYTFREAKKELEKISLALNAKQ